jgi:hypothetical protein
MTANDFVKIVRSGSDKLRVDEVVINTGSQELHGKGMLKISRNGIEVEVTVDKGETIPEPRMGIFTKRDNWKVTGLIEDQLQFKCEWAKRRPGLMVRCNVGLHPIELVPSGWDAMTRKERNDFHKQYQQAQTNPGTTPAEVDTVGEPQDDFSFSAMLYEYPLLRTAPGSEVKGETECFEYVLTKDETTSDLHVALKSKKDFHSAGEQDDWIRFYSFMNALAFANGIHALPYRIEYFRAGQKITDRVTTAEKLVKTSHSPFSDRLAFNAQTGSLSWNLQDVIKIATSFFDKNTAFSREVVIILCLFREADDGVHSEITTLALCTLFENLVRLLFREYDLKGKPDDKNVKLFEQAKSEVADQLARQISEKGDGYRRLHNVVRSAHPFSMEQMLQAVVNHFGLIWQGDMENIYKTWSRARHPLVHDKLRAETSEDKLKESVIDESQIAGAINILLLKLFGYSGHMRHSALEDGYRKI